MLYFEQVVAQFGHAFRQHVQETFDVFVHLRNELDLRDDGHRPMNEHFRRTCDDMLLSTLAELGIPCHVVGGPVTERLRAIVEMLGLPTVVSIEEAVARADEEYARLDWRLETERERAGNPRLVKTTGGTPS